MGTLVAWLCFQEPANTSCQRWTGYKGDEAREKSRCQQTLALRSVSACGLFPWVKLYRNSAVLVHVHTTSGCSAEPSSHGSSKR